MRLFFALWPPPDAAATLAAWASLVAGETGGTAVVREKVHLTLAFLGEADPVTAATAARPVVAAAHALPVEDARYWKHNKIVWAGPRAMPSPLAALVRDLHAALAGAGFRLEERPFAAHVTLVRKARPSGVLPPLPKVQWPAGEFLLVQSSGGRYLPVERFPLS